MQAVITFSSLTYALAAQRAFAAAAIASELVRLDRRDSPNGCANGLSLDRRHLDAAVSLLERRGLKYGAVIEK